MKASINVVLWDDNIYLLNGMRIILKEYFLRNNMSVTFSEIEEIKHADLVVTTSSSRENNKKKRTKIIMFKKLARGVCHQRKLSLDAEIELLEDVLDWLYTMPMEEIPHDYSNKKALTPCETQTLHAIAAQLSIKQIAEFLDLSRKTVCAHKYTAMQKLGLRRTHSLYQWLMQGGLLVEESESLTAPCPSGREQLTQQPVRDQIYSCTTD